MKNIIERYAFSIFLGLLGGIMIIYAGLHYEYKFIEFQIKSLILPVDITVTKKRSELTKEPENIPEYTFGNVYKKIDLIHESDNRAKRALIKFISKDKDNLSEAIQLDSKLIFAAFVDLDDDGKNEIIGAMDYLQHPKFMAHELFILKKGKQGYERIYAPYVTLFRPIYVLNSKTRSFRDIGFQSSSVWKYRADVAIMQDNMYVRKSHNVLYSGDDLSENVKNSIVFAGRNRGDEEANKILYNYIISNHKDAEGKIEERDIEAYYTDITGNNRDAIIGTTYSKHFNGRRTSAFFVLEKRNGKYVNALTDVKDLKQMKHFAWGHPIDIMKQKDNGHFELRYYELLPSVPLSDSPVIPTTLKYNNGKYISLK